MPTLSGPGWVSEFPTRTDTAALLPAFGAAVDRFINALQAGGATVAISATLRPPERAYLMHYAYRIAHGGLPAASVPAMAGVDIAWAHPTAAASKLAAKQMVTGYGIVYAPALASRHSEGRAIDMTITGHIGRTFNNAENQPVQVNNATQLHALGASFGVIRLPSDPPHWSDDGH
jgi:D-alanyl-D-alanine dipeptidase